MIKLIIFDLWNTLAYHGINYSCSERIIKELNLKLSKREFIKLFEKATQEKVWKSKEEAYKNVCLLLGIDGSEENVRIIRKARDEAERNAKLFPHSLPMVKQLKKDGFKLGLLSNSTVFEIKKIKYETDLFSYIDYPLFSFQVGTIKPDLKFFEVMLIKAECEPQETLMIGDSIPDDIEPSKKIGINAIHFSSYEQLKRDFAKFQIFLN